jgi:hypothetical protein
MKCDGVQFGRTAVKTEIPHNAGQGTYGYSPFEQGYNRRPILHAMAAGTAFISQP